MFFSSHQVQEAALLKLLSRLKSVDSIYQQIFFICFGVSKGDFFLLARATQNRAVGYTWVPLTSLMTGSAASASAPGRHICLVCPVLHLANTCWLASVIIYSIFICSGVSWFGFICQCLEGLGSGISPYSAWPGLQLNLFLSELCSTSI